LLVGVGVFLVYAATNSGEGYGQVVLTADSLLRTGDLSIDARGEAVSRDRIGCTFVGPDGNRYAVTGFVWALVVVPFRALGWVAHDLLEPHGSEVADAALEYASTLYDPVCYALCAALLVSLCYGLSGSLRLACAITCTWALGTMTWVCSKHAQYVSIETLEVLGVLWFASASRLREPLRFGLAGACMGLLLLTRSVDLLLLPGLLCCVWAADRESVPRSGRLRRLGLFMGPVLALALVAAASTWHGLAA